MLVIRFSRVGRKNRVQFRIVAQEHTIAPSGKYLEVLGSWDPCAKKGEFKNERIKYWMDKGARVSDSVFNLLIAKGVIEGSKRVIKISKKKSKKEKKEKEGKENRENKNKATEEEVRGNKNEEEKPKEEKDNKKKKENKSEELDKKSEKEKK